MVAFNVTKSRRTNAANLELWQNSEDANTIASRRGTVFYGGVLRSYVIWKLSYRGQVVELGLRKSSCHVPSEPAR